MYSVQNTFHSTLFIHVEEKKKEKRLGMLSNFSWDSPFTVIILSWRKPHLQHPIRLRGKRFSKNLRIRIPLITKLNEMIPNTNKV